MDKRLTEIMVYESMRVRVEIFYDRLISTVEAKETAVNLIIKDRPTSYAKRDDEN
jgi:hypothetical protein